jgi:hypothetical protein
MKNRKNDELTFDIKNTVHSAKKKSNNKKLSEYVHENFIITLNVYCIKIFLECEEKKFQVVINCYFIRYGFVMV